MSLILDALNRARKERGETGATALPATIEAAPAPGPLAAVLAVALGLAVLVIGWLAWERWGTGDGQPVATAGGHAGSPPAATVASARQGSTAPAGAASAPRPAIAPGKVSRDRVVTSARERSGTDAIAPDPAVAALYATPPGGKAGAMPDAGPTDAGRLAAVREASPPEAAPPKAAPPKAAPRDETIDIEAVVARAREELGEPALAPHPAPLLADLSQQQKDAIPTLMYLRHDYVENGASSVLINGETRRVGDRIGTVQVEEILRDSVVLRHRDTLFRLRALNSWVNL
ncbi:MAG: general secretion pathway protein GspB [Pseudohaliea sp.]